LSLSTARIHLSLVFEKRQPDLPSELARLLLTLDMGIGERTVLAERTAVQKPPLQRFS
jgi:hypothetical protein